MAEFLASGPTFLTEELEFNIHRCPPSLRREFRDVFIDLQGGGLNSLNQLLIVQVFQKTVNAMTGFYDEQETEREAKATAFVQWSRPIIEKIRAMGYWADAIDPLTGQPITGNGGSIYVDTEIGLHFLGYQITDVGCCKILKHRLWGNFAYPSSLFSLAPLDVTLECIQSHQ